MRAPLPDSPAPPLSKRHGGCNINVTRRRPTTRNGSRKPSLNLDAKAYAHYSKLTENEIKTLVVDDKWLPALDPLSTARWTASVKPSPSA